MKGRLKKKLTKARTAKNAPQVTIQEAWRIVADYLETRDVAYCCFIDYDDNQESIVCKHATQGALLRSPRTGVR